MNRISSPRANVLGVEVDPIDLPTAVRGVLDAVKHEENSYACLIGAHGIVESRRDPQLADAYRQAALRLPDGMPTVWFGRWQGFAQMDRVFGPELMSRVFDESQHTGERHFLWWTAWGCRTPGPMSVGEISASQHCRHLYSAISKADT